MSKKKSETTKNSEESTGKLGTAIPVRLREDIKATLKRYEESGLNTSEIIRRCVDVALPDVINKIREELGRTEE